MKRPIINEEERRFSMYPELEIATLKLKRELRRSDLGQLIKKIAEWMGSVLY